MCLINSFKRNWELIIQEAKVILNYRPNFSSTSFIRFKLRFAPSSNKG
jgi:hypothetical protein